MERFPLTHLTPPDNPLAQINDSNRLHACIIDSTEFAVICTDLDGTIISFNKAAENLTGYAAIELIGKATPEIFHVQEELTARASELSRELGRNITPGLEVLTVKVREKTQAHRSEWTFVRKDETRFPVIVSVTALRTGEYHVGYCVIAAEIIEQKKVQQKIEKSEGELKALVSSIDDIVFELDEQRRFIDMWVRSDDYLFLPREKILGRTLSEMLGESFAKPFDDGVKDVIATGSNFNWEYKSPTPGDDRWFCAKASAIYENGVRTKRISVCIQDITFTKKMELSLRESEEKFRLLAENIPGVVYLMKNDESKSIVYVNNEIENLTGYKVEDFISNRIEFESLIHEDDRLYLQSIREKAAQDKLSFQAEYRIYSREGKFRWVAETGNAVYEQNNVVYFEGCLTDISDRKQSEEEMRRMADENSRIFNNTLSLGAIATFEGYFHKLNPAWEKTLGWSRDELLSNPFIYFVHPDDVVKTEDTSKLIASGQTVTTFENRYRCKDGTYRWLLWSASPDLGRKIIYASAIDITSRKKSEDELLVSKRNLEVAAYELEEQNRQLDEFAHIISHNLRAPVNNIKALLSFINDTSRISDYQLIFEKIKNVTYNISETMNELLETIRIKKNYEIERVEIRFKDVLDKVIQSLEGDLIETGATITYNFNNAPKIYYSKAYLESILQNLLSNAIKYKSPKRIPEIFVSTDLVKNGIELRVQDNGLGIDLNQFGHKLFGLHKTFHENTEARGVGLFLTKTQIETLGGMIHAESEVDRGTTFIIQF